jgi:hypothetical protein
MSEATADEIRQSIVPKSDQLNADDLVSGPITVRIERVRSGDREQPIIVEISGYPGRPYKPCKTMLRILSTAYTIDAKNWIGKSMTLYRDPNVLWGGVRVGGIRISHLEIPETTAFSVTLSRTKRVEVTIHPIVVQSHQPAIDSYTANISAANSAEELKAVGLLLKNQPKIVQDAVRGVYAAKQKALAKNKDNGNGHISATLAEWKSGVKVMTTLDSCAEFRATQLGDCPEDIRAAVEHYLNEHEQTLRNSS